MLDAEKAVFLNGAGTFAVVADDAAAVGLHCRPGGPAPRDPLGRARVGRVGRVDGKHYSADVVDSKFWLPEVGCTNALV